MFDIHQKVFNEYGERERGAAADYIDGLMEEQGSRRFFGAFYRGMLGAQRVGC